MTPPGIARDRAMEGRLVRTLADVGLDADAAALVASAYRLAMEPRRIAYGGHHPDFLHPGRTALILVLDCGYRDPVALAAATLVESERPDLRIAGSDVRARLSAAVEARLAAIPLPGPGLVEALLESDPEATLIALAERLDHCRHAKFWTDAAARRRILEEAETVYGPIAERSSPELARRFSHWAGAFRRTVEGGKKVGDPEESEPPTS